MDVVAHEPSRTRIVVEEFGHRREGILREETTQALRQIMAGNNIPAGTALEQAIMNEKFLQDLELSGHKLLIMTRKYGNQQIREVIRRPYRPPGEKLSRAPGSQPGFRITSGTKGLRARQALRSLKGALRASFSLGIGGSA